MCLGFFSGCASSLCTNLACCFASKASGCLCVHLRSSFMTRLYYSIQIFIATILAWALYHFGARMPNTITEECDEACWQYLAVMRVSLAMVIYHSILCVLTFGIRSGEEVRAGVQNGYWGIKFIIWTGLIVAMFFVPDSSFYNYHMASLIFASIFIVLQSFLLVDFAWSWAQKWIEKWDETGDDWYKQMLIGFCVTFYLISLVGTVLMFIYYGPPNKPQPCALNSYFVSMNLILILVHSITSVLPKIQEYSPKSGLFQSSILGAYTTYLTASALISQPNQADFQCNANSIFDDGSNNNGGDASNGSLSNLMTYTGIIVTFVAIGYNAFASGSSNVFQYDSLENGQDDNMVADQDSNGIPQDEQERTVYSYSFFHFVFVIVAFYLAMVITDWSIMEADLSSPNGVKIVHGFGAMWAKIITSWVCSLLYLWTLIAPLIFPDRDFS
ncbi:hypothetical protein MP228_001832 [Amoeboaphelidium protococcarum]|nr:hypothetical protein MP228_001832 [Amoeboaphelidium protococcarum]